MEKPKFVYVTYITTTAEKLWEALMAPEFTAKYWFGITWASDWKAGSALTARMPDGSVGITGKVLEIDRPSRLVFTWEPQNLDLPKAEAPSRVTYTLETVGRQVKLTVLHDTFEKGSMVFETIQIGWPRVLSSLKSFLETGVPMEMTGCGCAESEVRETVAAAKAAVNAKA